VEPTTILILADESAGWEIAGLSQLDRLTVALDELTQSIGPEAKLNVVIFWKPDLPTFGRWLPRHPKIKRVRLTESLKALQPGTRIINTHVFVDRGGLSDFFRVTPLIKVEEEVVESPSSWNQLAQRFEATFRTTSRVPGPAWQYLETPANIRTCENRILRGSAKSQDGLVSKFINRPISRSVTRVLLKYDIDPIAWTMAIFLLPLIAFFFLVGGDYVGTVIGAALFQLYSILDGCDGEIARAKYLESYRGERIDDLFDMLGSVLYVIGLGLGLMRTRASIYAAEGVLCALIIVANEWLLRSSQSETVRLSAPLAETLYSRHRQLVQNWPLSLLNEKYVRWLIQLTKRDVAIFVFLVLALANCAQWILHLWLAVSAVILTLSGTTYLARRGRVPGSHL